MRTMLKSKIHRAKVTQAEGRNRIVRTGHQIDPAPVLAGQEA